MRKNLSLSMIAVTLALLIVAIAGCGPPPGAVTFQPMASLQAGSIISQQNTGIWVTGEGKVTVTPDIANLTLGVEAQSAAVSDAQSRAAQSMDAVVKAVKALGVAENDIKTISFSISPVYNFDRGTQTLAGYRVSNLVAVKIRKVADTGIIIDAVTKAGGDLTRINNISFSVNDPAPYLKQAREKAMADAAAKASQLASLGSVTLGKATYINESGGFVPPPIPFMRAEAAAPALAAPTTPISPGQTEINLNVQVVYSIQ